jgi:glycosyltransferase involved in cell wall biosynthesis
MKIFWIKQGPLFPLDTGGKIRTWNILKELGERNQVTALSFFPTSIPYSHDDAERHVARLISVPVELPKKYSLSYRLDYLRKLVSPVPFVVRQYRIPQVRARVRELLREEKFDVVVCDFLFPCLNLPDRLPCPLVLFAHNAETMIWKRHFEMARHPLWKLVTGLEYWKMLRFERQRGRTVDHVITVSDLDRDWFARAVPTARISVVPTGVDLEYFRPSPAPGDPRKLVFTGSMDWLANEDAIIYFAENILPIISRAAPGVTLSVVGRDPTDRLRRLATSNPQIQLTGTVADVRPYICEAAVYVLPLRIGSGTRLKVFEAMAAGKAIVSTHVGAEGLPVVSGEHLLMADKPEEFAASVVALLNDAPLREQLGRSARRLVESSFGWSGAGRIFQGILDRVAEQSRSASPRADDAEPLQVRLAR